MNVDVRKLRLRKLSDGTFAFRDSEMGRLNWDFTGDLVLRLDNLPDDPASRRVVELIEQMQRATAITEHLEYKNPKFHEWYVNEKVSVFDNYKSGKLKELPDFETARIKFQDPMSQTLYDELVQLFANLKKILRRYKWRPTAGFNGTRISFFTDYGAIGSAEEWENWCVDGIMQFADAGILSLFRRCRQCGEWLASIPVTRKYCSDNCRQKFASQSSAFKDKRRIYMRDYRKREHERDQRARRLAGTRRRSAK